MNSCGICEHFGYKSKEDGQTVDDETFCEDFN